MAKFLDDLIITGNNTRVLTVNSSSVSNILLASSTGNVAVGANIFTGGVYSNPKFIINTGSGIPGLMHLNSFGVELVTYTNVGDSLFGNASNHDLAFITNNVQRIKVTAAGNVGINHLTPPARLTVVGTGSTSATDAMQIANSSSSNLLTVRDDGRITIGTSGITYPKVGIGTASSYALHISVPEESEGSGTPIAIIESSTGGTRTWLSAQATYANQLEFRSGGLLKSKIHVTASALAIFYADSFDQRTLANVSRFFIDTSGNVGIGTSSPTAKLHVESALAPGSIDLLKLSRSGIDYFVVQDNGFSTFSGWVNITAGNGLLRIISNGGVQPGIDFLYTNGVDTSGQLFGQGASMFMATPLFGIGTWYFLPTARLHIKGIGATSATYGLKVEDSASANLLSIRNDGKVDLKDFSFYATAGIAYYDVTTYNTIKFRNTAISVDWMTFHVANLDITLHKKTNIISTYTPSSQESLEIGSNTVGTHTGISTVGVGNIMFGNSAGGLGMAAIGKQGGYLSGTSATMRFSYDPISFGDIPLSVDPNNYRIGIGVNVVSGYRVNIADGLQVSSSPASPTGTAINIPDGSVVINELSGVGIRTVNVDESGTLIVGIAAGSAVDGSGTVNYIPKWVDANTLTDGSWIFNGNDIYPAVSGSNIGNDTSPDFRIGTIYMASNIDHANALNINSGGSTNFTFTTAGYLGINTTTPSTKFEVSANDNSSALISTRYQSSVLAFANFGGRKARGTAASPTAILAADGISAFNAIGYSGAAFNASSGRIAFTAAENFTSTASGTNFYLQLAPIGSLAPTDVLSVLSDGTVTVNSFTGTGDRMVESDTNGVLSATRTIVVTYGVPNTEKIKLENAANWDVNGVYTGTAITGTYQGQKHYDDNYFYEAVADNLFIRLIRG